VNLAKALPLSTPFVVQIFPVYACNFKCGYCIFSLPKSKRGFISESISMRFDLYKKCIDELALFPEKIKVLRFVGIGEPLLHKDIVRMVRYAAKKNIARKIEIITNGLLLTPRMSEALIGAGLSRLVVSLQGISKERYKKISGIDIDFARFLRNLRYFYENRGKTEVYLKIIDCALENKEEEKEFYRILGGFCDTLAVEHAVPIHSGINYRNILKSKKLTQFGLPVGRVGVCPQPFFTLQVNPDGKVVPCYSFEYPQIVGDCRVDSLRRIWNGEAFQRFRQRMLEGTKNAGRICGNCDIIKYRLFPEDDLKHDVKRLKKIYA